MIRPVEGAPPLNAVIVTLGLLVLLQAVAGMIWGGNAALVPARVLDPAASRSAGTRCCSRPFDLFTVLVVAVLIGALVLLFRRTDLGLQMRAAAFAPEVSRLLGVRVGRDVHARLGAGLAGGLAGRRCWSRPRCSSRRRTSTPCSSSASPPRCWAGWRARRARWSAACCSGWR